jgi:hypothetical protein
MMIEAPTSSDADTDAAFLPKPLRGKRKVKGMKTPGMGAMMGSPRRSALPSMGKVTPMEYASGGSVSASKRADGCAVKGKTKGRFV